MISGGFGAPDSLSELAFYWYDLVLSYEYLIDSAGYDHEDILVFFGDGKDWDSTDVNDDRYELPIQHPDWPDNIVDHPNDMETLDSVICYFADNKIDYKDNLLIWLPRGHGTGNPDDSCADNYYALIMYLDSNQQQYAWYFSEGNCDPNQFNIYYDVLKFEDGEGNKKYKRKKIIWSTCRSGHIIKGNKTLLNGGDTNNVDDEKTIVIAGCDYNEQVKQYFINNEIHSGFTYGIYCTLMGKDPWGEDIDFKAEPDDNGDGVISMHELYESITSDSVFIRKSWDDRQSTPRHPQKADPCPMAKYTYIDEHLRFDNATLSLMQDEDKRYYRVDRITTGENVTVPDDSNIEFVVDTEVRFKPGFHAEKGSRLRARVGELECP